MSERNVVRTPAQMEFKRCFTHLIWTVTWIYSLGCKGISPSLFSVIPLCVFLLMTIGGAIVLGVTKVQNRASSLICKGSVWVQTFILFKQKLPIISWSWLFKTQVLLLLVWSENLHPYQSIPNNFTHPCSKIIHSKIFLKSKSHVVYKNRTLFWCLLIFQWQPC